jgi:hypothetical protein
MGAAIFSFILSPAGKFAREAALVAGLLFVGWLLLQAHDARVLAEQNLVTQQAIGAEQAAHAQRTIVTLQQENAQAMADVAAAGSVKRTISNVPNSSACASSPRIGAALRGLQPASGGHAAQGKPATSDVEVPAGAGEADPGN